MVFPGNTVSTSVRLQHPISKGKRLEGGRVISVRPLLAGLAGRGWSLAGDQP